MGNNMALGLVHFKKQLTFKMQSTGSEKIFHKREKTKGRRWRNQR